MEDPAQSTSNLAQTAVMDYGSQLYDPPGVPWWFLLIFFVLLRAIASLLPNAKIWSMIVDQLWALWGVYICLWFRRLEPDSKALYWALAYTCLDLLGNILSLMLDPDVSWVPSIVLLAYVISLLAGIYVFRAELQRHYNSKESFSLWLGPVMTFFFSFVYFQYHLNDIAAIRKRDRESLAAFR